MGKYAFEELMDKWKCGHITADQAIGQMLQHMQEQREKDMHQYRRLSRLERMLEAMIKALLKEQEQR